MSDPNKYADIQSRINMADPPWDRHQFIADDGPPQAPEFHAERLQIVLEVNVPVTAHHVDEVRQLERELNRVARHRGRVTLTVNGYGLDLFVDRAQIERKMW